MASEEEPRRTPAGQTLPADESETVRFLAAHEGIRGWRITR
jgi:hypothetical protein